VALSLGVVLLLALPVPKAAAAPCDAPIANEIACENTKPGNPSSDWQISGSGSASIQGFATDISVNRGSTIGFKVKTTSTNYRLDIYRMGYYQRNGARKVATVTPNAPNNSQPACQNQGSTGLIDCGNWTQTASWAVPADAVSGIYFALLVAGSNKSHILFIVRNDASTSGMFFQTSDTTWQAYNDYGGNSLYEGSPAGRAYKVSYNRPFDTNAETPEDFVWNSEYPMIRFLEANGYDVSYTTGLDTERRGNLITNHKIFMSVGHDEYWSGGQRANVEAARNAGVNLAFFSGNEAFWKTRWENSISTGSAPYRTLVSYKETHANAKIDPNPAWTGTWRDPRFSPPSDGGRPENGLTGTSFMVNCCTTDMEVDGVDGQMRFWRNTRVANLNSGQSTTLGSGILGYEWDESPDNGFQPAGLIRLSTTTRSGVDYLKDYGSTYAPGTATHHLTMYRAPSGALVFGAGTVQWAWGLDDKHSGGPTSTADDAVRQATVNLFADMGIQPATLQSGLSPATASSDTTAPLSTISAPADGATVPVGQPLTVSGTATDAGGGKVGGIEVSTDNGTSWHTATGRGSWSYTFTPGSNGTLTIRTRATDDSLRMETPSVGRTITVGTGTPPPSGSCPCSIWPSTATPTVAADSDSSAIEVGVKFRASQAGAITGIRFYKGSGNTGTHVGSLWSASGTKLGSATFTGESGSGWQQVNFATPVTVAAGTTYVASYYAPNGHYSTSDGYLTTPTTNGPLTALQDGSDGPNGVYKYGETGFPTVGYAASNYWVDVVYDTSTSDTTKPTVTSKQPASGATGVDTSTDVTATFSEPVTSITMTLKDSKNATVSGSTAYDSASRKATFTPSSNLKDSETYTASISGATDAASNTMDPVSWSFTTAAAAPTDTTPPTITARAPAPNATGVSTSPTVTATFSEAVQSSTIKMTLSGPNGSVSGSLDYDSPSRKATFTPGAPLAASTTYTVNVSGAKDLADNTMDPVSWSFTTAASNSCPCTIWPSSAIPDVDADPDNGGVEVGVKFRTTQAGTITKIRFYKGSGNSGTHVGSLWTRTGTKLASVTFTGESSSGWQEATFANPVSVSANTTYVASYYAPAGHYSVSDNYFTSATTRGPLTALKDGTDGVNGVYKYGSSGFPTSGYQSSNYWVDVVLTTN
jgi:methionine-rich copper-binding protein CopC